MLVSVVTATLNRAESLGDTFESLLGQSFRDFEYIVKDGGSTDGTLDLCREYMPRFQGRMRVVSCPDKGIYDAMNQGIAAAKGDVIGILNSDDFLSSPYILEAVVREFLSDPGLEAVYGDVRYVRPCDLARTVRYYSGRTFRPWMMRMGFMPPHPSFYCRREVYGRFMAESGAYYDTSYPLASDFDLMLRMLYVGGIRTRYIGRCFVTMRTGGASSRGIGSSLQITRDHLLSLRKNGVWSCLPLLAIRYMARLWELGGCFIYSLFH